MGESNLLDKEIGEEMDGKETNNYNSKLYKEVLLTECLQIALAEVNKTHPSAKVSSPCVYNLAAALIKHDGLVNAGKNK